MTEDMFPETSRANRIAFDTTPETVAALDLMVSSGLYGKDRATCAEELVRLAIRLETNTLAAIIDAQKPSTRRGGR